MASIGPVSISTGSTPTLQVSTMRARGFSPSSAARSSVIISTAAAPSLIWLELPAVCTPFSRATGFSDASFSSVVSRMPSSRLTVWVVSAAVPSSLRSGASTVTYWPPKRSSAHAWAARCWLVKPHWSVSSRVMPHFSAMRSAPSNWEVIS